MVRTVAACVRALAAVGFVAAQPLPPSERRAHALRVPNWLPTYDMKQSTILYRCNLTGYHDPDEAAQYGIVAYDWSNAKNLWANTHPMTCEGALTEQAKMVMPRMPQRAGYQP